MEKSKISKSVDKMLNHGSLFNGIGGFQVAASWMGWQNKFSCEIDDFCNKVIKKHFPDCIQYGDIKTTDFTIHRGETDILTGGFPCQPFSVAGQRKGSDDDRFLWHEMLRAIREVQPTFIVAENVPGLLSQEKGLVFEQVCSEMEAEGYQVQPLIIPACAVNAPHRRDRVWIVAYNEEFRNRAISDKSIRGESIDLDREIKIDLTKDTIGVRCNGKVRKGKPEAGGFRQLSSGDDAGISHKDASNAKIKGLERGGRLRKFTPDIIGRQSEGWEQDWMEVAARVCSLDAGVSDGLVRPKGWRVNALKAVGNSVNVAVVYEIFKAIAQTNETVHQQNYQLRLHRGDEDAAG